LAEDPSLAWAADWTWRFLVLQYVVNVGYCALGFALTRCGMLHLGEVRGWTLICSFVCMQQFADAVFSIRQLWGEDEENLSVTKLELRSVYLFRFFEVVAESVPQLLVQSYIVYFTFSVRRSGLLAISVVTSLCSTAVVLYTFVAEHLLCTSRPTFNSGIALLSFFLDLCFRAAGGLLFMSIDWFALVVEGYGVILTCITFLGCLYPTIRIMNEVQAMDLIKEKEAMMEEKLRKLRRWISRDWDIEHLERVRRIRQSGLFSSQLTRQDLRNFCKAFFTIKKRCQCCLCLGMLVCLFRTYAIDSEQLLDELADLRSNAALYAFSSATSDNEATQWCKAVLAHYESNEKNAPLPQIPIDRGSRRYMYPRSWLPPLHREDLKLVHYPRMVSQRRETVVEGRRQSSAQYKQVHVASYGSRTRRVRVHAESYDDELAGA
jgi:hypothetical protein